MNVDGILDDNLPLDSNLEVGRDFDLSQGALEGQTSGEKRGCELHDESDYWIGRGADESTWWWQSNPEATDRATITASTYTSGPSDP
jgi:hypothetical protein